MLSITRSLVSCNLTLIVVHVRGVQSILVDSLSLSQHTSFTLDSTSFEWILTLGVPVVPQVDLMVSPLPDVNALGLDVFKVNWNQNSFSSFESSDFVRRPSI